MFRDTTVLLRDLSPSWAGQLRPFYAFSWALSPNSEFFSRFVPAYSLAKFISHTGCGGGHRRDPIPLGIVERYSRCYPDREHVQCFILHTGVPPPSYSDSPRYWRLFDELSGISYRTRGVDTTNWFRPRLPCCTDYPLQKRLYWL